MPVIIGGASSSSAAQSLPTVLVYDYLYKAGDATATTPPPLKGAEVRITLQHDRATTASPVADVGPTTIVTTTDANGYWYAYLVPNAALSPTGTTYSVQTPYNVFRISVTSTPSSQQASTITA